MKELEKIVRTVDPTLKFIEVAGDGTFGLVLRVADDSREYALKLEKSFFGLPQREHALNREELGIKNCSYEYNVQKALSGIKGIPEAHQLYLQGNAFLMDYVEGKTLKKVGKQDSEVLDKILDIAFLVNLRGYTLPLDFVFGYNVLIDSNKDLHIIDFMLSKKFNSENRKELAETQAELFRAFRLFCIR